MSTTIAVHCETINCNRMKGDFADVVCLNVVGDDGAEVTVFLNDGQAMAAIASLRDVCPPEEVPVAVAAATARETDGALFTLTAQEIRSVIEENLGPEEAEYWNGASREAWDEMTILGQREGIAAAVDAAHDVGITAWNSREVKHE